MASPNNPRLVALWSLNRDKAIEIVSQAFRVCDGNAVKTAEHLQVSRAALYRWMSKNRELVVARDRAEWEAQERAKMMPAPR